MSNRETNRQGRYLPVFAAEILQQNKILEAAGSTPINLASILIGNGYTNPYMYVFILLLSFDLIRWLRRRKYVALVL